MCAFAKMASPLPLLNLDTRRINKRGREEEEENEREEKGKFEWHFVGRDASGGLTHIPYRFVVGDGSEIDTQTYKYLKESREIHRFGFKVFATPFVTPSSNSQVVTSGSRMRITPQQFVPVFEEASGFVIHSKWINDSDSEMYAFITAQINADIQPLEDVVDPSCQKTYKFAYGLEWLKSSDVDAL